MKSNKIMAARKFVAKGWKPVLLATVVLSFAAASSALAGQGNAGNNNVMPPQSHPFGKTYGEWSAEWWKWAYSLPVDQNPFFDETGCQNGANGQSGPVWFLTGVINASGTAYRTCTVPYGKALFFPILNVECATIEGNGTTEAELRGCTQWYMDGGISGLACEVDGVPIRNIESYRAPSPLFFYGPLPEDNVVQMSFPDAVPGSVSASVADGFYLMLKPLTVGQHTIRFTGTWVAFNFTLDITYDLTVQ
jgi:hypothetical protein